MNIKKGLISIAFIFTSTFCLQAQYTRTLPFFQEYYIGAAGGVNYYLAEGYSNYSITDALGAIGQLSLGYRFTPVVGVRAVAGFSTHTWPNKENNYQPVALSAQHLILDMTVNLSNLFDGYDRHRGLEFILLAGAGGSMRNTLSTSPTLISPMFNGALEASVYLAPSLYLNVQAQGTIVSDSFNNYIGTKMPFDAYPALTVGLSYRFTTPVRTLYTSKYRDSF